MTNMEASRLLVLLYAEWYKNGYGSDNDYSEAVAMAVGALTEEENGNG